MKKQILAPKKALEARTRGTPRRTRPVALDVSAARLEDRFMPAVITPFAPRFSADANGDIVYVANTLMTAPASSPDASNAQAGVGSKVNNNDFSMVYVDVDSNPSTFDSSEATLLMPAGGSVLWAGLYWGAESDSSSRNRVLFQPPGASSYTTITGTVIGEDSLHNYSGFADVTSLVKAAGNGPYTVANVQATTGTNEEAGWTLVVAYGDPNSPPRNLTVFDGFAEVQSSSQDVTIPISGFKAPLTGAVNASLGFVAYEGDLGFTGDSAQFNGTTLSDAQNPADNFFNSSISNHGVAVTTKTPNYVNQMGLDADIVSGNGLIANGATSASIVLTTDGDTYYPAVVSTSIDLYAPTVTVSKTVSDLTNITGVRPGDTLQYTDTVSVTAGEAATQFALTDLIPADTTYVPGSLQIVSGANLGAKTDAAGDDQAEYSSSAGDVTFRLGTGANSSSGGTIAVGGTATISFRVTIDAATPDQTVISSQAAATFVGQTTEASLSATSNVASITVTRPEDVAVSQSASNTTPNVGDTVTLKISLATADGLDATGVAVSDLVPAGLQYVSSTPSQGTYNATTGAWSVGTLDSTATLTIQAQVTATAAVTNVASITAADQPDPNTSNNTSSLTITPLVADLKIVKAVSNAAPNVGDTITFTTTLTNLGPAAGAGITVSDILPSGFTFVSASADQGTYTSGTGAWAVGSLPVGSVALTITAQVTSAAASTATATISASSVYDPVSSNSSSSVTVTPQQVDLSITKTASNTQPNVGDLVVLTTRVANAGPSNATGVQVTSAAGSGLTIVSYQAGQGTFNTTTGVWTLGSIAASGQAVLQVTAQVTSASAIVSGASLTQHDQYDTSTSNNSSSVTLTPQQADLSPSVTLNDPTPVADQDVTFTVALSNAGPNTATDVAVSDSLPAGYTYVSSVASQGTFDSATGSWSVGTVASGAAPTLAITAEVTVAGAATDTATIASADQYDPNTSNNTASDSSNSESVDLSLASAFSAARPNVGDTINYTVILSASGSVAATGVAVAATLPAGLTFVSASAGAGTYESEGGTWDVGSVSPGSPVVLTFTAKVATPDAGSATATITSEDQFDTNTANNTATATYTPQQSDLSLTSTISDATPNVGETVTIDLILSNAGPDAATDVSVQGSVAGLTYSGSQGPGTFDPETGTWSVGTIAAGQSVTLAITSTITAPGEETATAQIIAADQYDPVATNNTTSVSFTPQQAGVSLSADVDDDTPNIGDTVTITLAAGNEGPDTATGLRVLGLLPAGLSFQSAVATQGTYSARTGYWEIGDLDSGGSATLTIVATVVAPSPSTLTASVAALDQYNADADEASATVVVTPQQSDLSITGSLDSDDYNVGDNIGLTLTVTNNGPDDATNTVIPITIPDGLSIDGFDYEVGNFDSSTNLWTIGTLESGTSAQIDLTLYVNSPTPPAVVATVQDDQYDPTDADRTATIDITPQQADLQLAASVDTSTPVDGQTVEFTFTLSDNGPDDATSADVSVPLPPGYEYVDDGETAGSYEAETGDWTVGDVANGSSAVLTLWATVVSDDPGPVTATITSADQYDPTAANNSASATVHPQTVALTIAKVVSDPSPNVGDTITYTISLINSGPDTATGVVIGDTLPSGITYVSSSADQGSYDAETSDWTVGSLAVGATTELTLTATVTSPDDTINQAAITAVDQFDTDSANESAETSVQPQQAELRLTGQVDNPIPLVGDVVTYTFSLTDLGFDAADDVAVGVTLPSGLSFLDATPGQGTYDSSTGVWSVGSMADEATTTLTLRGTVVSADPATVTAAIQSAEQYDPDTNDNQVQLAIQPQTANVGLSFSLSNARPNVGDTITLTVTLADAGPDDGTGISVNVPLPAGLTFVSGSPAGGTYDPTTGLWTVGTVASGSSTSLVLHLQVASGDPIVVGATVAALDQTDPFPDDDSIAATITPQNADLSLVTSVDNTTPDVGDVVNFTVTLTNNGPDTASNIRVTDLLPDGLTLDSATAGQGSYDPVAGIWSAGSLADGASAVLTIRAQVASPDPQTDTASILSADQFDPTPADNTASATVTPTQAALAVVVAVDDATPNVGDAITFTVTVTNNGPDDANGVVLLNSLPAGLTVTGDSAEQGTFAGGNGIWSVGTLPEGQTTTLTITATVATNAPVAETTSVQASDEYDPDTSDNTASVDITPQLADLALSASVDAATPNVGDTVTYTITLANNGPDDATGVSIGAELPAGLTFVSATPGAGTYDALSGTWTVGTVGTEAPITLEIVAQVASAAPSTLNVSVAHADQDDTTPGNNTASVTVTPQQADLSLAASVSDASPTLGEAITFTITLSNAGPDNATGAQIAIPLPTGLSFVSSDAGAGSYDPTTGLWTVGTVAPGEPIVLTLTATAVGGLSSTVNTSISHSDQYDPMSAGNSVSLNITPQQADLALTATVDDATPNVGDDVTLTLTLSDGGPDDASGVRVDAALPDGLTFVSADPAAGSYDPETGTWNVGDVDTGTPIAMTIVAEVTDIGTLTATASVAQADQYDPATANDEASVDVTPQQVALDLSQTVDDATPVAGQAVTFTVTLTNAGPDDATDVSVLDAVPAGTTFVSADPEAGTFDPDTGTWQLATIPAESSVTLHLTVRTDGPAPFTSTATIQESDEYNTAKSAPAATTVTPESADLGVTNTVDVARPEAQQVVTLTITLSNVGPDAATDVTVSAPLPAGLTFVSADAGSGSYDAASGEWNVASIDTDASVILTIRAQATLAAPSQVTATVVSLDQYDTTSANNTATASVSPMSADLSVQVDGVPSSGVVGQPITMQITVSNAGPDGADGVSLPVTIPPGFQLLSSTSGQGQFDTTTGLWTIGTVASGGSTVLVLVLDPIASGEMEFQAGPIHAEPFDPSASGDSSGAAMDVTPADTASLSGTVFADLDGNRVWDPGESGIGGITIILQGVDAAGETVRLQQVTAADGTYRFVGLQAGTYSLSASLAVGSLGIAGTAGGQGQLGDISGIVLATATGGEDYDFAAHAAATPAAQTAQISGYVYLDRNPHRAYNSAVDLGIATTRVVLVGVDASGHSVHLVTRTAADGSYVFKGLEPGTYSVDEARSRYFRTHRINVGTAGGDRTRHGVQQISIPAGESAESYNFGDLPLAHCRLDSLIGPAGHNRAVPRGPLINTFFPDATTAKHLRSNNRRA
jgi:large repetitive protein